MMKIQNIYKSDTITLVRTLLALCFLTTLLFTPINDLFPEMHFLQLKKNVDSLTKLNFFLWFDDIKIPYFISIIMLLIVISGFYPRITCFIQTWVSYSIYYTYLITDGGDQINIILTFLLLPICLLDNRRNGWNKNNLHIINNNLFLLYNASIALVFIQIQMAILYFNAGVAKMFSNAWLNGTAVYYWFNDPTFGAPEWLNYCIGFLFKNDYTVSLISWSVMILEIILFVGFFLKQKYKYLLFIIAFIFHFIIFIIHGLPSFGLSMTAGLILFYFKLDKTILENLKLIKLNLSKIINYEK